VTSGSTGKQLDSRSSQHQTAEHELPAALAAVMGDRNPQRREPNRTGQQQKSSDLAACDDGAALVSLDGRGVPGVGQAGQWQRPSHTGRATRGSEHAPQPLAPCHTALAAPFLAAR
jgi:hypothetical protein